MVMQCTAKAGQGLRRRCPLAGLEPEELLKCLQPRADQPGCAEMKAEDFRKVETVVVDPDGLLWDIQEAEASVKHHAATYLKENVAFINTLLAAGMRVVMCDSLNKQLTRHGFKERLKEKGISETCQVWTPTDTAAWYLKSQGVSRPLVVTTEASFLEDVRKAGFECLDILGEDGQVLPELQLHEAASGEHLDHALSRFGGADAVVMGPMKDLSPILMALIDTILDRESRNPLLVCCCPAVVKRKMRIVRNSIACQTLMKSEIREDFVDAFWPSRLQTAALFDSQKLAVAETILVGRPAYRSGMRCLLVLDDNLIDQLHLTKERRAEYLPDFVIPRLGQFIS
ncbi:unnamed protein product [Effrenium voratum]|nr:unnamed protein product [Effrenium voratum]